MKDLISGGSFVSSGLISDSTKFIFRSRSAEYILFFQMTKEMWDYSPEDGQLYFEKAVEGFLPQLFEKWQQTGANHSVTVIFFSRTYYSSKALADSGSEAMAPEERGHLMTDWAGRFYHDFYSVIAQHERITDLPELKRRLKQKFLTYPSFVNWNRGSDMHPQHQSPSVAIGENSSADTSNFLEAISLGQAMFDRRRYIDCDLTKSGQTIVLVSAGTGIYHVDAALAQDVKQRMVDNGTGCDLVCLTKPPLHVVPLFVLHYLPSRFLPRPNPQAPSDASLLPAVQRKQPAQPGMSTSARTGGGPMGSLSTSFGATIAAVELPPAPVEPQQLFSHLPTGPVYKMAHWMFLFFWESNRKDYGGDDPIDRLAAAQTFVPSCRVPGLQFKPLMSQNEIIMPFRVTNRPPETPGRRSSNPQLSSSPSSPPLDIAMPTTIPLASNQPVAMDEYDTKVFGLPLERSSSSAGVLSRSKSFHTAESSNNLTAYSTPALASNAATAAGASSSSGGGPVVAKTRSISSLATTADPITPSGKNRSLRSSGAFTRESSETLPNSSSVAAPTGITKLATSSSIVAAANRQQQQRKQPGSQASSPENPAGPPLSARALSGAMTTKPVQSPNKKPGTAAGVSHPHSINPFNHAPDSAPLPSSNRSRWSHIFSRANMLQELYDPDGFGPHWKSLSQPGALPLTTGYMPTQTILNKDFEEYPHTIAMMAEDCVYGESLDDLFKELVSQRLLFGYQLVDLSSTVSSERSTASASVPIVSVTSPTPSSASAASVVVSAASGGMPSSLAVPGGTVGNVASAAAITAATVPSADDKKRFRYVLSTGYSFHKLGLDASSQNVEVKRYHRKKAVASHTRPLQYKYFLSSPRSEGRLTRSAQLAYQAMVNYKWNHIDQLVAGYAYDFFDSLIFWRLTMMLVPATQGGLSSAGSGFEKFREFLVQKIAKTTMDEDFSKMQVSQVTPAPPAVSTPEAAAPVAMLETSNLKGILLGLHSTFGERKSKSAPRSVSAGCFGAEALDWIMRNVRGCNGTASSTNVMTVLIKSGYLTDTDSSGLPPFDANHIYSLSEAAPGYMGLNKSATAPVVTSTPPPSTQQQQRVRQRTVRLEMDRSRTDRVEWVNLKYDTVFNPEVVYEMELQWLVGTGGVVLDFVNSLVRRAKTSGLALQLIPTLVDQRTTTPHPFFANTTRPFHFARLSDEGRVDLIAKLTHKMDFIVRKSPNQYIHRSGAILLDIKIESFDWTVNFADSAVASAPTTIDLVKRLHEALTTLDMAPLDDHRRVQPQVFDSAVFLPPQAPDNKALLASMEFPLSRSSAGLHRDGSLPIIAPAGTETEGTPVIGRLHNRIALTTSSESAPTSPQLSHHHTAALHHPHVIKSDQPLTAASAEQAKAKKKKVVTFARNTNPQVYWLAMGGSSGRPISATDEVKTEEKSDSE